uniref:ribosomal protein S3 n=1 Tax=Haslea provincialis TaxID=1764367 RepID=UPI0021FADC65|nr:ribosomal protein S3 [Haslea provincialis]UXN44232.1 ribosomal protein S3 [Haslea provincialis]
MVNFLKLELYFRLRKRERKIKKTFKVMKHWKSKYIEKNSKESHTYLFTSLEVKHYIQKFLKNYGLTLHDYQINFSDSTLDVYVSYYQTLRSTSFIQKTNLDQKIQVKRKRFNKKLTNKNSKIFGNQSELRQSVQNYSQANNNFVKKKLISILNILELLKLEYYSLKSTRTKKQLLLRSRKRLLIHYYTNCFKYYQYLSFLLSRHNFKKRIQTLKYYKTYLDIKQYKTLNHYKLTNFTEKLLEGLALFTKNRFAIVLTLQQINRNLSFPKKSSQNLKRILSKLRKFQRNDFFNEGINTLFNAITRENSAELITKYIAYHLKFMKRHKFFLTFIDKTLTLLINQKFTKIKGIKLKIRGRINNSSRSKLKTINIGKISLVTVDTRLNHAQSVSYGSSGTFGVQAWVSY